MNVQDINGFSLSGLAELNVILGKNGCGKSFLLKQVEQGLSTLQQFGRIRYISPERGGTLVYDPGMDQTISQNPGWMSDRRRRNQAADFRPQSATLFRRLEYLVLREIERDHVLPGYTPRSFDETIDKLNLLLDRVRVERDSTKAFRIIERDTGNETSPDAISSGESELISLGIEFLVFVKEASADKPNILFVDEPDVHLHPDLQDRLARFIVEILNGQQITLVVATHSTALLAALSKREDVHVAFMRRGDKALKFQPVTDVDRTILPIFGAHPLSNVFNESPILLIEGEDDERVWQQVVRSAQGRIRLYPCAVDGVARFAEFEGEVNNVIEAIYDDAKGYSLRDRDLQPELIDNVGHVIRMRLNCRTAENMMLSDDVLALAGTDWQTIQQKIKVWADANGPHQYHSEIQGFINSGYDRKDHDLKQIRNILIGLFSSKPWEVLVGQGIARFAQNGGPRVNGSLGDFLGDKACKDILRLSRAITKFIP